MNNILIPEKNNKLLKFYHHSSKMLIPGLFFSVFFHNYDNNVKKFLDSTNILNIGYHSYVSSSCIITDYIKPKMLSKSSRVLSLGFHSLAIYGYLKNTYKN